ncbi:MAG: S41 family peptidase [Thermoanaerobaculia bacterium]
MPRTQRSLAVAFVAILAVAGVAGAQTELLRFPDIHGDRVVFTYGGDLWLAPSDGGTAWRLTAHPGEELFAKFSPDGQWIAFTGQYDGDEQVYVVPTAGGTPRQLTWYPARGPLAPRWGYDNQVYDWTPDGTSILFRSMRYGHDLSDTRLFLVSVEGGLPEPLPMPEAGGADLSPDASKIVYSPLVRDFRAWKRYQGGWAQELYVFDLASHALERVTDNPRADRDPMWIGDTIYFTSDRDGKNNLYAWDSASKATRQITHETVWDVRWPADDGERIVYELGGRLQVLDLADGSAREISIRVPDDGLWKRPSRVSAEDLIEDFELSPGGERALFVARGDVFTVPVEHGATRNLTDSSDAHDKWARWSPDGSTIAYLSDASGEDEIWLTAQDGSSPARRLTHDGAVFRYAPEWSPDGERIAFSDKNGQVFVVDVASGETTEVADEARGEVHDYTWSPDGGYLAFSLTDENEYPAIWIWSAGDGTLHRVTDESAVDFGPAWGADGKYLYYFSDRAYAPQISSLEWNFATDRETYLYALALRDDVEDPFPPQSDEVAGEGTEEAADAAEGEPASGALPPFRIDFDGLADRVAQVPIGADNYGGLTAAPGHLLYVKSGPFYYGRDADVQPSLWIYSLADREETRLAEAIDGYALSGDGSKVLVGLQAGGYQLLDATPDGAASPKPVATAGLQVDRVPEQEWRQIFAEVWRRFRDFFYVENMHGYDWQALRERYEPLLDHVAHRSDLNYVMNEMIAELSAGHTYIAGGDWQAPERAAVALPGAVFELDEAAGRYRLATIFPGINEESRYRSPLTQIGVDVDPGDYVLAVDGEELLGSDNPYRLLRYKADRPVELTVSPTPSTDDAHTVTFEPLGSETDLRYLAMVEANKRRVDEMTDGRVGYIHIPDMGSTGIQEFIRQYYPQIRKQGLIVDVRSNGGGNVSQMIIERLRRHPLGTRFSRNSDTPTTYPGQAFYGPMVCLLDEDSASDGDIFPYYFREAGLGPLIGKRSWGGVTGITGHGPLLDGGSVFVPEFGTNALDGSWVIEGHGVDPDIVVENDATSLLAGRDPQLERGIEEVLKAMAADPKTLPERPAPPVKTD